MRDIVYDCLRQRRSFVWRSGQDVEAGRALVCGMLLSAEASPQDAFDGSGYGPPALSPEDIACFRDDLSDAPLAVAYDFPDFLEVELQKSLGERLPENMTNLQSRAPVDLRINTLKSNHDQAIQALALDEIQVERVENVPTALRVTENARRINNSRAYRDGLVELQDASSQAVALASMAKPGMTIVDYCAGGGGKTLALAALMNNTGELIAHDSRPARMKDIPRRAGKAGARIKVFDTDELAIMHGRCDLVLVDAPCSGSGSWRRNPDAKWRLNDARLRALTSLQGEILDLASKLVRPGGRLIYATCSILRCENGDVIADFLKRTPTAKQSHELVFDVDGAGDGFYLSDIILT